MGFNEDEEGK